MGQHVGYSRERRYRQKRLATIGLRSQSPGISEPDDKYCRLESSERVSKKSLEYVIYVGDVCVEYGHSDSEDSRLVSGRLKAGAGLTFD